MSAESTGAPRKPRAGSRGDIKLVIGGEPRAGLLPPEVLQRTRSRSTRRALIGVVVLAILVSGGGWAASLYVAGSSVSALESEQERTTLLIKQQGEFAEVLDVEARLEASKAAQRVATSTEVDWSSYVGLIRSALSASAALTTVTAEVETPVVPLAQASAPLQGLRVATINLEATSATVPDTARWMERLAELPGFVDAMPGSVSWNDSDQRYEQTLTMHIDSRAFSGRFAAEQGTEQ